MARNDTRPVTKVRSAAGARCTYVTRENGRNDSDRPVLRTYDAALGRHVDFRQEH
ncbi:50S ribosomal protein L33 [Streptomyces sp. NPDC056361]|uniref:50S ribosomal protein L33 n=1 Tax=Streptomyces sp. NPDC056361 TaxID=3345795 RepID=UPI0035DE3B86